MSENQRPSRADFIAQASARIRQLSESAEDLTHELGLPPEMKYDVLATVLGGEQPNLASARDAQLSVDQETQHRWRALLQLGVDFVAQLEGALQPQLPEFQFRGRDGAPAGATGSPIPLFDQLADRMLRLETPQGIWLITEGQLTPYRADDGEMQADMEFSVIDEETDEPVAGQTIGLRVGSTELASTTDEHGVAGFHQIRSETMVQAGAIEFFYPDQPES